MIVIQGQNLHTAILKPNAGPSTVFDADYENEVDFFENQKFLEFFDFFHLARHASSRRVTRDAQNKKIKKIPKIFGFRKNRPHVRNQHQKLFYGLHLALKLQYANFDPESRSFLRGHGTF